MKIKLINILLIIIVITISSCGIFKKVFKSSSKHKENVDLNIKKEDSKITEDKSKTVINEKIDTLVKLKPVSLINQSKEITSLVSIKDLILLSNDLLTIRQTYDTLTKKLTTNVNIHPRTIPITFDKITTISNDIKTIDNSKQDIQYNKDIKNKKSLKTKEPKNIFWFVVLGIGLFSIITFSGYKYFKK